MFHHLHVAQNYALVTKTPYIVERKVLLRKVRSAIMSGRRQVRNDDDFEDDEYDVAESALLAPTHSDSDDGDSVYEESDSKDVRSDVDEEVKVVERVDALKDKDEIVDRTKSKPSSNEPSKKRQKLEALKKARGFTAPSSSSSSSLTDANSMLNAILDKEPGGPYDPLSTLLSSQNFISSVPSNAEFSQLHLRAFSSVFSSLRKALRLENIEEAGSPKAIVVCSSAARATEVIKDISKVFKVKIAKLYAKHFKVHEQVKMLQEKIVIGVGTPNRLNKLIEVGALSLAETEILVIDSHKDSKNFTILTLPEVKNDLYNFLRGNVAKDLRHIKLAVVGSI